jgi:hypothetical protein
MPVKFSKEIGECYRLAAEARENASAAADPVIRQDFLDIERRWLLLAHRHRITAAKPRGRKTRLGVDFPYKSLIVRR